MQQYFSNHPTMLIIFIALVIWSAIWKAMALWKAARNGDKVWFAAIFIINTAGLLEIFYIFAFSKRQQEHHSMDIRN